MSSVIKVNACVYSRIGYKRDENTNTFYMNGKFLSEQHVENVQASMENRGTEYLFAVSDNMNGFGHEDPVDFSIQKEIGRFHEKITVNGGDIGSKVEDLIGRVSDKHRAISEFLELNRIPQEDDRWGLGFGSIILSDSQMVAVASGNVRIFLLRSNTFKPLALEASIARGMLEAKLHMEDFKQNESDRIATSTEEEKIVSVSEIIDLEEGDAFLICSAGIYEALGEDKIEDLLSLRSDSTYIAARLVDEAMKRSFQGDLTAMVVHIEKLYEGTSTIKRTPPKQDRMVSRVDKLNKAPAVTYKYTKNKSGRYFGALYLVLSVLTVAVLFGIVYLIINSMINTGKDKYPDTNVTVSASPTGTPSETPTDLPSIEPTDPATTEPTPTPEANAGEIKTHVIKSKETMNSISRTYYGSDSYADELCEYNNIADPTKIQIGQKIKIPPKADLE